MRARLAIRMDRDRDIAIALLAAQSGLISDGQLREALTSSLSEPRPDAVTDTLVARGFLKPHDLARLRSMAGTTPTVLAGARQGGSTPLDVHPSAPTIANSAGSTSGDGAPSSSDSTVAHVPGTSHGSTATVPAGRVGEASSAEPPPSQHGRSPWEPSDVAPPGKAQVYNEMSEDARNADAPLSGRFADYHILRELGRGGMGVVYEAEQGTLGRRVALKVLPPALARGDFLERFHTEARAAAKLRHANIVQVYETGRFGGHHFIAMELVAGKSLHDVIKTERITPRRAATLTHALADALAYAHANGVIHRDVKPTNVIVGQGDHVYLMDFGLAREGEGEGLTRTDMVIGTPSYMPPEQAKGERGATDAQSDVYSLGATLYELLTGQPPFVAATWQSIIPKVMNEEPSPPRKLVAAIPRDLETIVLKAMEKTKLRRYSSMASLRADLKRWLEGEPIQARPVSIAERLMRKARKNRAATGLGTAVLVVLLAAVGLWWRGRERDWAAAREKLAEFKALRAKGDAGSVRASWDRLSEAISLSREGREFLEAKSDARYEDLKAAIAKEQYDVALLDLLKDADAKVGKYAGEIPKLDELITGIGSLEIHTDPEGASYKIYDFNEKGLWDIQQSGDKYLLASGTTPMPKRPWPMGEYLIIYDPGDFASTNYPIAVERNEAQVVNVKLLPAEGVPKGFVYIPEGLIVMPSSKLHADEKRVVHAFLVASSEVRQCDYSAVLLAAGDDGTTRIPKRVDGSPAWSGPEPPRGHEVLPISGITSEDAAFYCTAVGGRLPTRDEFLRLAAGETERRYCWGNQWLPGRVACLPSIASRVPVRDSSFCEGESPFGCWHVLGNVSEWIAVTRDETHPVYVAAGGSIADTYEQSFSVRATSSGLSGDTSRGMVGLRVVRDLQR